MTDLPGIRLTAIDTGERLPPCPLCGQLRWLPAAVGTTYRRCPSCALWFNARSQTRVEEERLYDHCASVPVQDQETIAEGYWTQLQDLVDTRGMGAVRSVLDVGCGSGQFLARARDAGAEVGGLELDPAQVAACKDAGLAVHFGSLFDIGAPPGPWQVVTFWDVLDHLEAPVEALQAVIQQLECGGIVVARGRNAAVHVPLKIAQRSRPELFRRLRIPDVSVVHRWGFTPRAWIALFQAAGLENVRLYAGVPTPGDRYRMVRAAPIAAAMKRTLGGSSLALARLTGGRAYLFPSVVIVGRKRPR